MEQTINLFSKKKKKKIDKSMIKTCVSAIPKDII